MDLAHITIAIMSYREGHACPQLAAWASKAAAGGAKVVRGSQVVGIAIARNQTCNRFLAEDAGFGKTHLVMVDADMVPLEETGILTAEAARDLVYCGYAGRDGSPGA